MPVIIILIISIFTGQQWFGIWSLELEQYYHSGTLSRYEENGLALNGLSFSHFHTSTFSNYYLKSLQISNPSA